MAGWWEWGQHKQQLREKKHQQYLRSRDYGRTKVKWNLSSELMPATCKTLNYWGGKKGYKWYVNNSPKKPVSFVYLLIEEETNDIKYVGLTDDPPRRYSEHYKNKTLNTDFIMSVIEVGGRQEEKELIEYFINSGCDLLNKQNT